MLKLFHELKFELFSIPNKMLSSSTPILILPVLFFFISNDERRLCYGGSKTSRPSKSSKPSKLDDSAVVADNELIFSHIIFRHGDRNPSYFYQTDPYFDPKYWEEGRGELTNKGKQRLFELGQYLRRRYQNLMKNQKFSPDLIYVRSSSMSRTKQSAEAAIAGFSGQKKLAEDGMLKNLLNKKSNDAIKSIPVNTVPQAEDHLIYFLRVPCPRYEKERNRWLDLTEGKVLPNYRKLFDYLERYTNETVYDFAQVYNIYDALFIEKSNNLTLGNWTKELFHPGSLAKDMEEAVRMVFKRGTGTKLLARFRTGFLLRDMLNRCTDKSQSKLSPNYSFYVYSGHDSTIFTFLNNLGLNMTEFVPYGACILFELYKPAEGDHYVQMYYKNTTAEVINPINIPNCGTKCTLEQFRTIYQDIIPTEDYATECKISKSKK